MENIQLLGLAAFVVIAVRLVAQARGGDWDGVFKALLSFAAGVGAVAFYAHTGQADGVDVGGTPLSLLSGTDQVLLGISMASLGGVAHVGFKALDGTQSAKQPTIVKGPGD